MNMHDIRDKKQCTVLANSSYQTGLGPASQYINVSKQQAYGMF